MLGIINFDAIDDDDDNTVPSASRRFDDDSESLSARSAGPRYPFSSGTVETHLGDSEDALRISRTGESEVDGRATQSMIPVNKDVIISLKVDRFRSGEQTERAEEMI